MTQSVTEALDALREAVRKEALAAVESALNGGAAPKPKAKKPLSPAQRAALKKMWAARRTQARAARAKR